MEDIRCCRDRQIQLQIAARSTFQQLLAGGMQLRLRREGVKMFASTITAAPVGMSRSVRLITGEL